MKRCPTCNQRFNEAWLSFCPTDGSVLVDSDGSDTDAQHQRQWSEQATLRLPRPAVSAGSWAMPDEHQPLEPVWRAPPPPVAAKPPSQGLAIASMITAIAGLVVGCLGPLPGIAAVIMGLMALSQIKKSPEVTTGKPLAWAGVLIGGLSVLFYLALLFYFVFRIRGGNG